MNSFKLYIYRLLTQFLPETRFFGLKCALLRWCGARVGQNVRINSTAIFSGNGKLTIGDDVWIGAGCFISAVGLASITIGSHIDFGPQVMVLTGSHKIDLTGEHIGGEGTAESVAIGDGCWLGARSTILPGVSLNEKTLIAAGAVVVKSTEQSMTLVAGVPAKQIKKYS